MFTCSFPSCRGIQYYANPDSLGILKLIIEQTGIVSIFDPHNPV